MAKKVRSHYTCQSCGHQAPRWFGRCPACEEWNTCAEELPPPEDHRRPERRAPAAAMQPITEVSLEEAERLLTGLGELDRVLGGGIMPGSVVLVGGDPGIGKSTLLLQMAGQLAGRHQRTVYLSAEESGAQIRLRAGRIGSLSPELLVFSETNLASILEALERAEAMAVIIDSIQTIYYPQLESAPGSVAQVRECAARLVYFAKERGVPVFLVGHVTKEGTVAGPRTLEHLVDTVLYLEGERHHHFRILRAAKNRFGSTNEIGVFEMRERGLVEVGNPSQLLLAERAPGVSGSAVVCTIEGTRPLLVEIQALVSTSSFGYPQRVATGIDPKRLALLVAVLEKRGGYQITSQDIFVNVVGGIRVEEPSVDLGVALALVSSFLNRPIEPGTVAIGEIGLGGEVRPVDQIERRVAEARNLGFTRCLVARSNLKGWRRPEGMEVVGIGGLEAAQELALLQK
ncbi:MAG: DNA repair protein RadA [Candidatus Latescibacteria bacterium]|nr:DNA repair protein RadA [Candidatus Latescibacterota bacterium]